MKSPTLMFILLSSILVAVTQGRVTFPHSEVLQQSDLDGSKTARFKCDNGCLVYSDSGNLDMWILNGSVEIANFPVMGAPISARAYELKAGSEYRIQYRGEKALPNFVFYAVDKTAPYLDTPVYYNYYQGAFMAKSSLSRRFTLLNSFDYPPEIVFAGNFAPGYPRAYATGFDASEDKECSAVYHARSSESAVNSVLKINSPIVTIDKGPTTAMRAKRASDSVGNTRGPNTSVVYLSPGFVGCSYVGNQLYFSNVNTVQDKFGVAAKSLDLSSIVSIPSENEAVHITVNEQKVDLFNSSPIHKHYEAARFDVSIEWTRKSATSSFAIQFDLGEENE